MENLKDTSYPLSGCSYFLNLFKNLTSTIVSMVTYIPLIVKHLRTSSVSRSVSSIRRYRTTTARTSITGCLSSVGFWASHPECMASLADRALMRREAKLTSGKAALKKNLVARPIPCSQLPLLLILSSPPCCFLERTLVALLSYIYI